MPRHGGRRRGAGRKPLPEGKVYQKVSVSLPPDLLAYARKVGGQVSYGVQQALAFHRTKHKKPAA